MGFKEVICDRKTVKENSLATENKALVRHMIAILFEIPLNR